MKIIHCAFSTTELPFNSSTETTKLPLNSSTETLFDSQKNMPLADNYMEVVKSTTLNDYNHTICIDSVSQEPMMDEKLHALMIKCKPFFDISIGPSSNTFLDLQPLFCNQPESNTGLNQHIDKEILWTDYQKINKEYAEAIVEVYNHGDMSKHAIFRNISEI
jgi:hypothetical protein